MKKTPNIVLINCDDLGYGDLGCYGSGINATPSLDRLASEGMRFTDFYMASSICTPSRAGMMTGCYPQRISMNRVLFPGNDEGLNPSETTIARILKTKGYSTRIIGKWHCGDQPEFLPLNFGFDSYFGLPYSNDMGRQSGSAPGWAPGGVPPLPLIRDREVVEQQPNQENLTERYLEDASAFLREHGKGGAREGNPFFLYFAHMYVHLPIYVPDRFMLKSKNGRYGAAVACIDWVWSVLDDEMKKLGLHDDTLVIFTSDNGSRAQGEGGSNAPLKGTKFTTWEGGFRLPCIMRWPGRIKPGSVCKEIVSSIDFLPTLASLAGADAASGKKIDGLDVSKLLLGGTGTSPRANFAYYSSGNLAAVRYGKWKLHFSRKPEKKWEPFEKVEELYNLESDPGEIRNVYAENLDVVRKITLSASELKESLGDRFTGVVGTEVRPCGKVKDAKPLTVYNENHPYVVAEYDLSDRG